LELKTITIELGDKLAALEWGSIRVACTIHMNLWREPASVPGNMTVNIRTLAEVTHRAIEILCRELGAADTMRFINQFTNGHGDYTAERDALFAGETLDQIIADIKSAKHGAPASHEGVEFRRASE
jgi:hypothetical protein